MSQFNCHSYSVGVSPLERLPPELLIKILRSVSSTLEPTQADLILQRLPVNPNTKTHPLQCLLPCLLTSRTLLTAALPVMYRSVEASRLSTLENFLAQLKKYLQLNVAVRRLDLSNMTCSTTLSVKWKQTTDPLLEVLSHTPLLRDFRISNSMEAYLTSEVLKKLFCCLDFVETIDLSGCHSERFIDGCIGLFGDDRRITKSVRALNLAGCSTLHPEFFESLLSQLPSLRHLDVSNTQITSAALQSIPATVRLTHLSISHCYALDGKCFVDFLTHHSATKELVYLGLETSPGEEHQILVGDDVSGVLSNLPSTLRVLNLKNSAMISAHAPLMRTLSTHLTELSVGCYFSFSDIESFFLPPENFNDKEEDGFASQELEDSTQIESKYQTILTPMEEAIAICKLRQRINSLPQTANSSPSPSPYTHKPNLRYLDISSLPAVEQCKIQMSILLGPQTRPLEIIEISEKALRGCGVLTRLCASVGWEVRSVGRRCWMRRIVG